MSNTMTNGNGVAKRPPTPATKFKHTIAALSGSLLDEWVGPERAAEAKGRVAAAFMASAMAARDAGDFYACTPESIAQAVATSALTGIMPSPGATSLAYLVPQRPRRDAQPHLQYMLSHRGICALAARAGLHLSAVPVGNHDDIEVDAGEVTRHRGDIDNPPTTWDELRGVVVVIKLRETGTVLYRGWVPRKIIEARRDQSRSASSSYGPWSKWPVEMAMKTALKYAVSRGWCVIDDTEAVRALSLDGHGDTIDTTAEVVTEAAPVEAPRQLASDDDLAAALDPSTAMDAEFSTVDATAPTDAPA